MRSGRDRQPIAMYVYNLAAREGARLVAHRQIGDAQDSGHGGRYRLWQSERVRSWTK